MAQRLFNAKTLQAEFQHRRERAANDISFLSEIKDKGAVVDEVYNKHQVRFAEIHRDRATMPYDTVSDGVLVTLRIPFTGSETTFWLKPPGTDYTHHGMEGGLMANRSWLQQDQEDPHLRFQHTFKAPTPDEVKAWAKQTADEVQANLTALREPVAHQNQMLRDQIIAGVDARAMTLKAGGGLGDLGTGI